MVAWLIVNRDNKLPWDHIEVHAFSLCSSPSNHKPDETFHQSVDDLLFLLVGWP